MNSPALSMANLLIAGLVDWSVFVNTRPSSPKDVITVYDVSGSDPIFLMDGSDIYNPNVMIQIVSTDNNEGYLKADEIRKLLNRHDEFTEFSALFCGVWMSGDINYIGKTDDDRSMHNINFNLKRQEV